MVFYDNKTAPAIYLNNYTTHSHIDNLNDFWDHIETTEQVEMIAIVKMHHENNCGRLAQDQDIEISCIHPQEDTFKAIAVADGCFVILCDLFIEYSVVSTAND